MLDSAALDEFVRGARIEASVFTVRPDYRAMLVAVDGLVPGGGDGDGDSLVRSAEASARQALDGCSVEEIPHVAAWRDAYRAFGAKPQRTRNSLEALLRRAAAGLPRINRLTDVYNAVSVLHQIPLGGEDLTQYVGPPRLIRSTGAEAFDTASGGVPVVEHPEVGEVVWCDNRGVTCRRWNWRQARRTQLREHTTTALFVLDALNPVTDQDLAAAADDLLAHLNRLGSNLRAARRVIEAPAIGAGDD